jgi:hypothetical protein
MQRKWVRALLSVFVLIPVIVVVVAAGTAADETVTLVGTLLKTKHGIVFNSDEDRYMVIGQDLSSLVGRKVKVTGKVIRNYRGKSLMVATVEIVHD